jgi:hypothetical protein
VCFEHLPLRGVRIIASSEDKTGKAIAGDEKNCLTIKQHVEYALTMSLKKGTSVHNLFSQSDEHCHGRFNSMCRQLKTPGKNNNHLLASEGKAALQAVETFIQV